MANENEREAAAAAAAIGDDSEADDYIERMIEELYDSEKENQQAKQTGGKGNAAVAESGEEEEDRLPQVRSLPLKKGASKPVSVLKGSKRGASMPARRTVNNSAAGAEKQTPRFVHRKVSAVEKLLMAPKRRARVSHLGGNVDAQVEVGQATPRARKQLRFSDGQEEMNQVLQAKERVERRLLKEMPSSSLLSASSAPLNRRQALMDLANVYGYEEEEEEEEDEEAEEEVVDENRQGTSREAAARFTARRANAEERMEQGKSGMLARLDDMHKVRACRMVEHEQALMAAGADLEAEGQLSFDDYCQFFSLDRCQLTVRFCPDCVALFCEDEEKIVGLGGDYKMLTFALCGNCVLNNNAVNRFCKNNFPKSWQAMMRRGGGGGGGGSAGQYSNNAGGNRSSSYNNKYVRRGRGGGGGAGTGGRRVGGYGQR